MSDPIELTTAQQFELERFTRLIEDIEDVKTLRNLGKMLLRSWMVQQAATRWVVSAGGRINAQL